MSSRPLHLKGLNGLRAIAALAVVISHTTQDLALFNLYPYIFGESANGGPKRWELASFGVSIFFCLSGFLITYLLLLESEKAKIDIKKFYIRRVLRIWPLYYLYLFAVIIVILSMGFSLRGNTLLFYIFFSANVPFILETTIRFLGHYWSLGVEEQFYLFWPLVVRFTKRRLLPVVAGLIIGLILLKLFSRFYLPLGYQSIPYKILHVTRFHCMLIGAMGAILFHQQNRIFLRFATNKIAQFLAWTVILLIALNRFHVTSVLDNEIVSFVTLILIMGQITGKNRLLTLEGNLFDFLGKISYGIYVIHPLIIFTLSYFLKNLETNEIFKYGLVYCSVLALTIFIAYISYEYFEKRFLRIKHKYAIIKTSSTKHIDDNLNELGVGQIKRKESVETV